MRDKPGYDRTPVADSPADLSASRSETPPSETGEFAPRNLGATVAPSAQPTSERAGGSDIAAIGIQRSTDVMNRACDQCRRRRIACYILANSKSCFRCQLDDVDCTFTSSSASLRRQSHLTINSARSRGGSGGGCSSGGGAGSGDKQSETGIVDDYSRLSGRSLLKRTLTLQHPRSSFVAGPAGIFDVDILNHISLDKNRQARVSSNQILRQVADNTYFVVRDEGGQDAWINDADEIEHIVSPHNRALINCYFCYVQPSYPVLHEKVFLEKYARSHREITPAILGTVYLLALRWWYHSAELRTVARPGHLHTMLLEKTFACFYAASGRPSVSLVQAGLLLLQCAPADPRLLGVSSIICSVAYQLALNRDCASWKLPKWEVNLRCRLSWAVAAQSRWVSLFESVPSVIAGNHYVLPSLNADMFETDGAEKPKTFLFMQLMSLTTLLDRINQLLIQHIDAATDMEDILLLIKPIQLGLHEWHHDVDQARHPESDTYTLKLAYLAAETSLHRFIIRQQVSVRCEEHLANVCRTAAHARLEAAMLLLKSLQNDNLLHFHHFGAPYHLAIIGLFAGLMFCTSRTNDEAGKYQQYIASYMGILNSLSQNEIMSAAVRLLSSSLAGVPNLL